VAAIYSTPTKNARKFAQWIVGEFAPDGIPFAKRPSFAEITLQVWHVIGAYDFKDVRSAQVSLRVERFSLRGAAAGDLLANEWAVLRDRAQEVGWSSLWLLYDEENNEACLTTVSDRLGPKNPTTPDTATLRTLERAPSLADAWVRDGQAHRLFDRTSWVFTIRFPYRKGNRNEPSLWPNSPPLPGPEAAATQAAK
jgi:hypothetical protein